MCACVCVSECAIPHPPAKTIPYSMEEALVPPAWPRGGLLELPEARAKAGISLRATAPVKVSDRLTGHCVS